MNYTNNPNITIYENHRTLKSKPILEHFLKTDQIETYLIERNFNSKEDTEMFGNILKSSKNLKYLKLNLFGNLGLGFEIIFEGLSENKSIEKLFFSFTNLTSEHLEIVGKFFENTKTLKSIEFDIPDEYLQFILSNLLENKNLNLKRIIFQSTYCFDRFSCSLFGEFLKDTKSLTSFEIKSNFILGPINQILQGIIENKSLESFFIGCLEDFESKEIQQIIRSERNLIKKIKLSLRKNPEELLKSLKLIPDLVEIDLKGSKMKNVKLEIFKEMLQFMFESTEYLYLTNCNFDKEQFKYFGKNLNQFKKLKILILDGNRILEEVAEDLFESLGDNTTLETLNMSICDLEEGNCLEILGKSMKKNTTLKNLDINVFEPSKENEIKFFHHLKENNTLERLFVSIKDLSSLGDFVRNTKTLKSLHLQYFIRTDEDIKYFLDSLKENESIEILEGMEFHTKSRLDMFRDCLEYNRHLINIPFFNSKPEFKVEITKLCRLVIQNQKTKETQSHFRNLNSFQKFFDIKFCTK